MGGPYSREQYEWYLQCFGGITHSGTEAANRQFTQMAYSNGVALLSRSAKEPAEARGFRLLEEAKARHPEWEVKKLQPIKKAG